MFLTVFTPTYNRAHTLKKVYDSLCAQTERDFEWLVYDDGSVDNTKELLEEWSKENKLPSMRYICQKNVGKTTTHNRAAIEAKGELFVCLDSDDYFREDAVEVLKRSWESGDKSAIGILAYKVLSTGEVNTQIKNKEVKKTTLKDGYDKYGLTGDTALIFKTDILRKHEFPSFPGEKFIPEAYLYDRLDQEGPYQIVREGIYVCEYLDDGYTANMKKTLYTNYQGYFAYIEQRLKIDKGLKLKYLDSIRYMAMAIARHKKNKIKTAVYPFLAFLAFFPGWLLYRRDFRRFQK